MASLECPFEPSIEQQVVSFVALQQSLLTRAGLIGLSPLIPRLSQQVRDDHGNGWQVITHGCGVLFRSEQHGIVVDAYSHLDEPRGIDVWRLKTFISSLPTGTRRRFERELAGSSLEAVLERLTDREIVEQCAVPGLFRAR